MYTERLIKESEMTDQSSQIKMLKRQAQDLIDPQKQILKIDGKLNAKYIYDINLEDKILHNSLDENDENRNVTNEINAYNKRYRMET